MATYAIGDIHGRADLLRNVLSQITPGADDDVIFLGDYIDRGADSRGVVDTLLEFERSVPARVTFLTGNHEAAMVWTLEDPGRHSWLVGMQGLATVRSYSEEAADALTSALSELGPELFERRVELPYGRFIEALPSSHREFFRRLKPYVRTPDVVGAHAGLSGDDIPVEDELEAILIWGCSDWWSTYRGADRVVYGHWGNAKFVDGVVRPFAWGSTFGIDCSNQGALLAMRFPDGATWSAH
ncbi:MAG: serine/threonine protein phosphatase [Planctomyces sp.]|nr:serine/threonine protein phosphatase [Planctomyces sp.]